MIDYLHDVKPLESDLSDAEIKAHLSTRTARPISAKAAKDTLLESGVVVIDPVTGNRVGPLIDHYTSLPDGKNKVLLAWFINHCLGTGQDVETNNYPRSAQFAAVEAGLPAEIAPVAVVMVNEAGGRPNAGTAIDVDVVRQQWIVDEAARQAAEEARQAAEEAQQAEAEAEREVRAKFAVKKARYDELYNEYIAVLQIQPGVTDADWSAALNSMADNFPIVPVTV